MGWPITSISSTCAKADWVDRDQVALSPVSRTSPQRLPMNIELLLVLGPVVFMAYAVLGLTGFGSAVIAVPIMVHFVPLQVAVPLIVLFDLLCTFWVGLRNWRLVSGTELWRIFPTMFIGIAIGTTILADVGPKWPLLALGTFVLLVAVHSLITSGAAPAARIGGIWAMPSGLVGGVFSALFGTGGPIYTIYLVRRLPDINQFRATISVVILSGCIVRTVTFASAGLYSTDRVLSAAMALLPFCLLGLFAGSRLRTRIPPGRVRTGISLVLVVAGIGVLYRGLVS